MSRWILQFKVCTERLIKEMSRPFGIRFKLYLFEFFLPIDFMHKIDLEPFLFLFFTFIEEGLIKVFFSSWWRFHLWFMLEDDWLHLHFRLLRGTDVSNWIIVLADVYKTKYIGFTFFFLSFPWLLSFYVPIFHKTGLIWSLIGHLEGVISCQIWDWTAFIILVRHFAKTRNRSSFWFLWTQIFSWMPKLH